GRPKTSWVTSDEVLQGCSRALATATLRSGDFEAAVEDAAEGDFVYFDPPYVTGHNNNGFVEYNESLFSWEDQRRLSE
ncbi:DNA adenine methylase, partial [Salmonella enterica]|uniref:DNA adenine methylase n=1 Tax=Salmonella enterica TaxID=28901 RepID=UPI003CFB76D1